MGCSRILYLTETVEQRRKHSTINCCSLFYGSLVIFLLFQWTTLDIHTVGQALFLFPWLVNYSNCFACFFFRLQLFITKTLALQPPFPSTHPDSPPYMVSLL